MTGERLRAWRGAALVASVAVALVASPKSARALDLLLSTSRNEVTVGEQFTVTVEVQHAGVGRIPAPELPPVSGLRQMGSYSSQNFSYVNGRATSSLAVQVVMVADNPGTYTIGPAHAGSGGDAAQSGTVTVTVKPAGSQAALPRLGDDAEAATHEGQDLIVLGAVDEKTPFVNQQVTYTFTFLRRVNLLGQPQYTPPATTGFWNEDLGTQEPREVVVSGRRYIAERVRLALFPTGPGEFTVGEAYLRATVEDARRARRDPFDVFGSDPFGLFGGGREVLLKTDPVTVKVRPLPEQGKPADFCGAVGRFDLTASVDHQAVKAGEPVTLSMRLAGEGNVKVVAAPDLSTLSGFKVYQSKADESAKPDGDKIHGEKKWEYVLVPTSGGAVEIPPIKLAVFDPQASKYVELATAAIPLTVEATPMQEALAKGGDVDLAKERVRLRERDIRYVKPSSGPLRREGSLPWARPEFLLLHAVPLLAFAGSVVARRHRDRLKSDVRYARRRGAARTARKHLDAAHAALGGRDLEPVFAEVSAALRGYVADRLVLAAANLEEGPVREGLAHLEVPPAEVDGFFAMLASCDGARFSPLGSDAAAAGQLVERARKWIAAMERR
ncbi:MAG: BatD family protein [bacterium]